MSLIEAGARLVEFGAVRLVARLVVQIGDPTAGDTNGESRNASAAPVNGPALLPTDDKVATESDRVSALMSPAQVSLQEYIAGSGGQSPGASVQGIIAEGDDPEAGR